MPRKKQAISFDDIVNALPSLSARQIQMLIAQMQHASLTDIQKKNLIKAISHDLDYHAQKIGLGKVCPKCGSVMLRKNGTTPKGAQKIQCTDCGHTFNYLSNTLMEKTRYSWDTWVEFIYMMMLNSSILEIVNVLKFDFQLDGITEHTVLDWIGKILESCKNVEQPALTGIVEVDETSFHEGQKGSIELIDPLDTFKTRKARKTARPSQYGALGPEFGTVICAVDHTGHTVSKYVGVGRASTDAFELDVASHFQNVTHLCSDKNNIYSKYCNKRNIIHYIRPSHYLTALEAGKKKRSNV